MEIISEKISETQGIKPGRLGVRRKCYLCAKGPNLFLTVVWFQFDQSDLLLPSAEYYLLGLGHPIMQTYYNLLVNVATLLGSDKTRAKREMKELIEFEIELASVKASDLGRPRPTSADIFI